MNKWTKVKGTSKVVDKALEKIPDMQYDNSIMALLLCDIAHSLAIIADGIMSETEKDDKEVES
jgi:hypothetical protein